MEKTKRYCSLISAILSVLGLVVFVIMSKAMNISLMYYPGALFTIFGLMVGLILLGIGSFINWKTARSKFKNLLWYFIILAVIEFAIIVIAFFGAILGITSDWGWGFNEIVATLFVVAAIYLVIFVLQLIDIIQGAKYKYTPDESLQKEEERKLKVSRPFTLSAGITSLVIGAALFVVMIWGISELASYGFGGYIPFIIWLNMASSAVVLTFGIITTCLARTRAEKYKRLRGLFLTAFITNSLQALISLIYVCVGGVGSVAGVINLIAILGCAMAATFFMLDYARKDRAQQQTKVVRQQEVQQAETPKPATEKKSRPFTLSASIVSTIVGAAVFGIMLYIIIALAQYGAVGYTPFIVWVNLISSLGVLGLGIPTIWLANSSAEKYKKAIGLFITAFVFSCLQVVLSLIYICVAGVSTIVGAISLIAMLGCAVSGTFYMLDIARKNKAQKQTKVVRQQEVQQAETPKPAAEKSLVQSLQEIKEMKEAGLINDEDYEKLKSNILSNYKF